MTAAPVIAKTSPRTLGKRGKRQKHSGKEISAGRNAQTLRGIQLRAIAIGGQVRSLRHKLDLTAAELAEQAGLSAGMLSKIETDILASVPSRPVLGIKETWSGPVRNFRV
jgi:DNA-binding XRE family transcriptional regulator